MKLLIVIIVVIYFSSYPEYLDVALAQTVSGEASIYNFCLINFYSELACCYYYYYHSGYYFPFLWSTCNL